MSYTINLIAPNSTGGFVFTNSATGNSYTADGYGNLKNVASVDVGAGILIGCTINNPSPIANFRNLIDGGDFTINPWQRGTSFTNIAGNVTYTADRWFAVGNASSAINVAQTSSVASLPGIEYGLQFTRASSNSSTYPIYLGQVLETADCYRTQSQQVTLSFYAQSTANFSQVSSALTVLLNSGTGVNQSASSMMASSWTNFTSLINSSVVITSSLTRYQLTANVPLTTTQLGIQVGFAGFSSAGAADGFIIAAVQLEVGGSASVFEHRDIEVELGIAQRYFWQSNEPSSGVCVAPGNNTSASTQQFFVSNPIIMRIAPTVLISSGSYKTQQGSSTSSCTVSSGTTHTIYALTLIGNTTGATSGGGTMLLGGGGTGYISASADF